MIYNAEYIGLCINHATTVFSLILIKYLNKLKECISHFKFIILLCVFMDTSFYSSLILVK